MDPPPLLLGFVNHDPLLWHQREPTLRGVLLCFSDLLRGCSHCLSQLDTIRPQSIKCTLAFLKISGSRQQYGPSSDDFKRTQTSDLFLCYWLLSCCTELLAKHLDMECILDVSLTDICFFDRLCSLSGVWPIHRYSLNYYYFMLLGVKIPAM